MTDEATLPASDLPAPQAPPVPSTRPSWLVPVATGLAGVLIGAAAVGAAWAMSPDSSSSAASTPVPPAGKFLLSGSMTLSRGAHSTASGCAGVGGYSDIAAGTSVTVYDAAGQVIATGELGTGKSDGLVGCTFPVMVVGVPVGPKFYQVEVSHRGKISLPAADAQAGRFAASLG